MVFVKKIALFDGRANGIPAPFCLGLFAPEHHPVVYHSQMSQIPASKECCVTGSFCIFHSPVIINHSLRRQGRASRPGLRKQNTRGCVTLLASCVLSFARCPSPWFRCKPRQNGGMINDYWRMKKCKMKGQQRVAEPTTKAQHKKIDNVQAEADWPASSCRLPQSDEPNPGVKKSVVLPAHFAFFILQ